MIDDTSDEWWRWIAKDPNGVPRCFTEGADQSETHSELLSAIQDYIRGRPDTGPMDKWTTELS